jgi:hypothetical protein
VRIAEIARISSCSRGSLEVVPICSGLCPERLSRCRGWELNAEGRSPADFESTFHWTSPLCSPNEDFSAKVKSGRNGNWVISE